MPESAAQTFGVSETPKVFNEARLPMKQPTPLEPGKYYHIFNRGVAGTNIFIEPRNYQLFLDLYAYHVAPFAPTFAYCLLRNHFHLFVRIAAVQQQAAQTSVPDSTRAFSNFFNAYAKTINRAYARTGSLFEHPFRRCEVVSSDYWIHLVHYIHFNPQKHGFVADFREYPHSSYASLLSDRSTRLQRPVVLEWFGGAPGFCSAHQGVADERAIWELISGDE